MKETGQAKHLVMRLDGIGDGLISTLGGAPNPKPSNPKAHNSTEALKALNLCKS